MTRFLLTCEHGGNKVPVAYRALFVNAEMLLSTHRGLDIGALDLFRTLGSLADASYYSTTSRLLVELNRSLHHPKLFSESTASLSSSEKARLLAKYYTPYRSAVQKHIQDWLKKNDQVIHISVHSFTPMLNGITRNADIGLLYDPGLKSEKRFAEEWSAVLNVLAPDLRVRMNYPYRGTADGFTTYLRKQFATNYIGIELEVNQKWAHKARIEKRLKDVISDSVRMVLN